MADAFLKKISSPNYDPEKCVQELTISSVGATDLHEARQKIQILSDENSGLLKRNVYKHYIQFIETAKEISHLESEMYQLSHMLNEQNYLMTSLLETSLSGTKVSSVSKENKEKQISQSESVNDLKIIKDSVEGCVDLGNNPQRQLIFEGDLVELDSNTFHFVAEIHLFLLTDSLLITTSHPNERKSSTKFKYQILYDLDSLAVVNVRDMTDVKNAFKFLKFPDTRLYVCDSPSTKKDWLEHLDATKKAYKNKEIIPIKSKPEVPLQSEAAYHSHSSTDEELIEDENHNVTVEFEEIPDWLVELPEDLDVCIAQRDFEEATHLIEKATDHFYNHSKCLYVKEMRPRIDSRIKLLCDALQSELRVSPGKSLQGGPRASRRAVSLLIKLGKASKACDLFLKHHSAIIKHSIKQLKIEGVTTLYIKRLCSVIFAKMVETGKSLEQTFPDLAICSARFVVWIRDEVKGFVATFSRQVFTPQVSLTVVSECVSLARQHCHQLTEFGLDMTFLLNSILRSDVERIIQETKDKLSEAIKVRALAEDKWRPMNLHNNAGLKKFLDDMHEIGIKNIQTFVYDECLVSLTSNTIYFSKAYLNFVDDVLNLHTEESNSLIIDCLVDIMKMELKHIELSLVNNRFKMDTSLIKKNACFLLGTVLSVTEKRFQDKLGYSCLALAELHNYGMRFGIDSSMYITKQTQGTAFV